MYQYHGWTTLPKTPRNALVADLPLHRERFNAKVERLRDDLPVADYGMPRIDLLTLGDCVVLSLHVHVNRRRGEAEKMAEIVKRVARDFEDSTGLIYEFDEQTRMEGGMGVYTVTIVQCGSVASW